MAVLAVGRTLHLGDGILPLVEEHRAARAVGHDEIGLVGGHAFELLVRIGNRVAAVGLHQIVAEAEAAAVAPLGIVDALAAPRLDHAGQHVGELRAADARLGENLGIVAADVLDHAQRFARHGIDQTAVGAGGNLVAEVEDDVRGVGQALRLAEFAAGRLVEVFARTLLGFGELVPGGEHLGIDAEGGDARRDEVLVARLGHQGELPRHHRHDGLQRHDVRMVADARARGVQRVVEHVAPQVVVQDVEEGLFASREKVLPDAAAGIVVAVVRNLLLVLVPAFSSYRRHGHSCSLLL